MTPFLAALLLSSFAGLSTGLGGVFVLLKKDINPGFLSLALGFSGGVMIYISMTELLNEATSNLTTASGNAKLGALWTAVAFFGGMLLIALIDHLVPDSNNPHELSHVNIDEDSNFKSKLMRSGVLTAIAIGIHNFPEGLATFSTAATDMSLGLPIGIAIAIHNIPEGIAVAAPIYKASGNRKSAFLWALISGLSEPIGGLLGYLILTPFLANISVVGTTMGILYGAVAGIMVFISLDELLPLAHEYGKEHTAIIGIAAGMAVMAASLILFM